MDMHNSDCFNVPFDTMKPEKTSTFLGTLLKQIARPILPLDHGSNSRKHRVKFMPVWSSRGFLLPFLRLCGFKSLKLPQGYEDPSILAAETIFSINEVEALYELFRKLSNTLIEDGLIHKEEFQLALFQSNNRQNLFVDRVFALFDLKENGVIEFGEFVRSASIFHPNTPIEEKMEFAFKLYDLRQTGFIERTEVEEMLVALLLEADIELSHEAISIILDNTFTEADINKDGRIDKEEWKRFVSKYPSLMRIMTLPCLKDVTTAFPSFIFNSEAQDLEL